MKNNLTPVTPRLVQQASQPQATYQSKTMPMLHNRSQHLRSLIIQTLLHPRKLSHRTLHTFKRLPVGIINRPPTSSLAILQPLVAISHHALINIHRRRQPATLQHLPRNHDLVQRAQRRLNRFIQPCLRVLQRLQLGGGRKSSGSRGGLLEREEVLSDASVPNPRRSSINHHLPNPFPGTRKAHNSPSPA